MSRIFFSYSHADEDLRDELEKHLSALKRQGLIETWHDRRIGPGEEFEDVIDRQILSADIVLLLVSADFLASDYCYEVELQRALERHESGDALVIPVILRPCDWKRTPFGGLLALPKDGKPVTKYPSYDDAFLDITESIASRLEPTDDVPSSRKLRSAFRHVEAIDVIRSSNLAIKKSFSDRDKDAFLHSTFEFITRYFEGSLGELEDRYDEIDTMYRRIDENRFEARIYRDGASVSRCEIRLTADSAHGGGRSGITYSTGRGGGYNEILHVEAGDHSLHMKKMGMFYYFDADEKLTQEGAAEYYWTKLIEPLQR